MEVRPVLCRARGRGDAKPPLMRLVGDRGELLLRHLQLARFGVARKDAAGRADLDHLGAIFALAADLIAQHVGRVADPLFLAVLLFEAGRPVSAVAMPAGRAERIARRDAARPGRISSEARRVRKACDSTGSDRWSTYTSKKKQ